MHQLVVGKHLLQKGWSNRWDWKVNWYFPLLQLVLLHYFWRREWMHTSVFSVPIHTEYSCNPSPPLACSPVPEMCEVLANCDFIAWDKVTMSPPWVIDGVDQLMRRVKERNDKPFGGCVVLFSGDFRQCLPIVKGNPTIAEVLQRCILSSSFIDIGLIEDQLKFLLDIGSWLHLPSGRGSENNDILSQNLHVFYPLNG